MKNNNKEEAMRIINILQEHDGVSERELATFLHEDPERISAVVKKLISRALVKEKDGKLYSSKGHNDLHKQLFKEIMKHDGIKKEDLIQATEIESGELEKLLHHLEKKGILEIKDNKLYADKTKFTGRKFQ